MIANASRLEARRHLAEILWRTPYEKLLKYGITAYREITNLDVIGVPSVWICNRPGSDTISVTAGKNIDRLLSFSGAIAEGIEFWASEKPKYEFTVSTYNQLDQTKQQCELLPFSDYPWAADNVVDQDTPISWENASPVGNLIGGVPHIDDVILPSNSIWLSGRIRQQFLDVPKTSNGIASGTGSGNHKHLLATQDAELQGLYELIERDGWTISQYIQEMTGDLPKKVPLVGLPDQLEEVFDKIRRAGLYPFLFDCTTDLGIPVFGCALLCTDGVGLFGGYGCHLNPVAAAHRALLEAVQGRLCYISGARDDMFRRNFILMKRSESAYTIKELESIEPTISNWDMYTEFMGCRKFDDVESELSDLLSRLRHHGIERIYSRTLANEEFEDAILNVSRVICPQLEGVWAESWRSNGRALTHLSKHKELSYV
jgi:ribosomal protein S12 methylthiotransferase accessory factor